MTLQQILEHQRTLQASIIELVSNEVGSDDRLDELWLGGSLGSGNGDALSDLDLVLVCAPGKLAEITNSISELIGVAGPVAFVHNAPWNAPSGGVQLNVLYDTEPLPIYVDWDVWPHVKARPENVRLLSGRSLLPVDPSQTVVSLREKLPGPADETGPTDDINRFRAFLLPIIAKYAWRGHYADVARLFRALRVETQAHSELATVLSTAADLLSDLRSTLTDSESNCIQRYLDVIERWHILREVSG